MQQGGEGVVLSALDSACAAGRTHTALQPVNQDWNRARPVHVRSLALPEPHDEGARRRWLVRRGHLNPNWYQTYRHAFLRAGLEIGDCPPMTSQGQTGTGIHMVLDIIDVLLHETRCDDFIVFSAEAEFTPVLRKLRRCDRRTTVQGRSGTEGDCRVGTGVAFTGVGRPWRSHQRTTLPLLKSITGTEPFATLCHQVTFPGSPIRFQHDPGILSVGGMTLTVTRPAKRAKN